ncbi:MAG: ABC transporter substrate-binding protein [Candidatus Thorarchaeota archaeon]|jgi:ABC-type transport system substrate-binding protein
MSILLFIPFLSPVVFVNGQTPSVGAGPYIDSAVYRWVGNPDTQASLLLDNEMDIMMDGVNLESIETLEDAQNIGIRNTLSGRYGYFSINTAKYPYNITAFRRAIAVALDKEYISEVIMKGYAIPQDSPIPRSSHLSIEDSLESSFYSEDLDQANELLDQAGFQLNESSGFRLAPNGSTFEIRVHASENYDYISEIQQHMVDTLRNLDLHVIDHHCICWHCCVSYQLYNHEDYEISFLTRTIRTEDVDFLAQDYSTKSADAFYHNFPNFRNSTYDYYAEQLLKAIEYDELVQAARDIQKILIDECPIIVVYEQITTTAYRIDRFENHANDSYFGSSSWWSNYQAHLKEDQGGPFGGRLRWGTWLPYTVFIPYLSATRQDRDFLNNIYDSLLRISPEGEIIPWLAESYRITTHEDDDQIVEGSMRITFEIRDDFFWSDGTPVIIEDIINNLDFLDDNPDTFYSKDLKNMTAISMQTRTSLIVEFNTESYWHLYSLGRVLFMPSNFLQNLSLENFYEWYPDLSQEDLITSGPFKLTEYRELDYLKLEVNPNFPFRPVQESSSTTLPNTSITDFSDLPLSEYFSIAVTISSLVVIVVIICIWEKKSK